MDVAEMSAERLFFGSGPRVHNKVATRAILASTNDDQRPHRRSGQRNHTAERRRDMTFKVLIVDDSKLARMVMARTFRRIRPNWELIEATNADEALAAVGAQSVDIALVDFNMPGTDGLELVAKIRQTHQRMPVAVVSANIQDEIITRARELNAAFVPKPLADGALEAFLSGAALRLKKAAQ
jgi:CheY-like chemotaxis protein